MYVYLCSFNYVMATRVVCEIAKRSLESADVSLDLLRGNGDQLTRLASRRVGRAEPSRIDATVSLADLAPGGYRLRVAVKEGALAAGRDVGFVVK